MRFARRYIAIVTMLTSANLVADEVLVNVFFEETPLQGVEVRLDREFLGKTNSLGSAEAAIDPGKHNIKLVRDDKVISGVDFVSALDQDVEISISFNEKSIEPNISVRKFQVGDDTATGFLAGKITGVDGVPISSAYIEAIGTDFNTLSDENGVYKLELPRGLHDIQVTHPEYANEKIEGVRVIAGLGASAVVRLQSEGSLGSQQAIEEVVVIGSFNPVETSADIERFATAVTDAIDISQLSRYGDGNVAAALTRIVGVTVTDDKYANVRGLDGRYISSSLNGLLMPSTDPLRRDVQLDLFPAGILKGIEIQKSYAPNLLGSTTGGSIKILTRGLPDEKLAKLSVSTGFNLDFTGDNIVSHRGSSTDGFGFDSGLRDLPRDVVAATDGGTSLTICDPAIDPVRCTAPLDAALLALRFEDDYNVRSKEANPDGAASLAYGDLIALDNGDFGYYGAVSYKHSTSERGVAQRIDPLDDTSTYNRAKENTTVSAYFVTGYEFKEADEVLSKTIFLRSTDDTTQFESGFDNANDNVFRRVIFEYVERQFFSQQFSGVHEFALGESQPHKLDWRIGYSETERYEPDRRDYQYINNVFSTSSLERRWSDLSEDSIDVGIDYTMPIDISSALSTEVKVGALWSDRSREVEQFRFGVRAGDNSSEIDFSNPNLEEILAYQNFLLNRVRLGTNTTSTDSYNADEEVLAFYITSTTEIGDWTIVAGVRQESFDQLLEYPNDPNPRAPLDASEVLPAFSLTYRLNDDLQLRGAVSQTVSYPGIIERSESTFFSDDRRGVGNPDLEVSTIDNYDLRVEYYFSDEESVSLAVFRKEIDNPIEESLLDGSGSASDGFTYRNSPSATLNGIEVDGQINLFERDGWLTFLAGNISYIDSKVSLDGTSQSLEGRSSRDLQGQSPWLANIQLGYDHYETEQKVTLLINYFDDRIDRISRGAGIENQLESGRVVIDVNYEKLFGDAVTFSAQIKNLFNEPVEFERAGRVIETYEEGTEISLKLEYEF